MKPRITYRLKMDRKRKATMGTIVCRIQLYANGKGEYDTGIKVSREEFDGEKQICGNISVQKFMSETRESIENLFRPGMLPPELWAALVAKREAERIYTVRDAFEYYLALPQIADSTRQNFGNTRDKAEKAGLLDLPITSVTPATILSFVNGLAGKESFVFLQYIQLKTVINRIIRDHHIKTTVNLENIIKGPKKAQVLEGEEDYLNLEQVQMLLNVDLSENKYVNYARDMFCLMCLTGMAVSDLCNFTPKLVSADKTWLVYHRKKTNNKCEIPLFPTTIKLIEKHKWPCRISKRMLQHHCQKSISELLIKNVTAHTARKTWGCVALEMGFSIQSVAAMLGHSSSEITERIYAKVTKQKIQREMKEIPESIRKLI